jgi:hypothetical protein
MTRSTALLTLLLAIPLLLAQSPLEKPKEVLLSGRITAVDEKNSEITFKAGSKVLTVRYSMARLVRHEMKPLSEVPAGTTMHAFARRTRMTTHLYYLEQFVLLVAGPFEHSPYLEPNEEKPHWETGVLAFTDDGNTMWIGEDRLHCGKDRPVCVIHPATIADFYELDKKGRIQGKAMHIRAAYFATKTADKTPELYIATRLILPTTGIPRSEYGYILEPGKLNEEQAAGKR